MRDFANLGFVLAIIVIAIGFILRLQSYGSQRTLTRLIFAAILVNFSLVIAGIFIDAANITTTFFLRSFQFEKIAASLIDATGINEVFKGDPSKPLVTRIIGFVLRQIYPPADIAAAIQVLTKFVIVSIFAIMLMAALGALIVMLLLRVSHLWVLLILSPMAWLMWIFPQFEHNWRRWWNEFLRWVFFAPIVTFFLAFSISLIKRTSSLPPNTSQNFLGKATETFADVFHNALASSGESPNALIAKFVISITLIVLSMIIANEMGVTFADQGVRWVSGVAKWPGLAAWRSSLREGKRRFATSALGRNLERRFARAPLVGHWADTLRTIRTDIEADAKKIAERQQILSSAEIRADLENPRKRALMSQAELLARAKVLNDRGETLPDTVAQTILQVAHNANPKFAEQFLPINPHLIESYEKNIAKRPRPRTPADYAARMTVEQAESFNFSVFDKIRDPAERQKAQALFASGLQPQVLSRMLEKNYENGETMLNILRNPAELQNQLRAAGRTDQEIRLTLNRIQRMLKSPQLAYWMGETQIPPPRPSPSQAATVRQAEEYLRQTGQYPFAT
jgi:hypothetical protein